MGQIKQMNCKFCGVDVGRRNRPICATCTNQQGLCTTCKIRPQDRLGYRVCSRCIADKQRRDELFFARTGKHGLGKTAEWRVRQIERDNKFAAELVERFKKDIANANG